MYVCNVCNPHEYAIPHHDAVERTVGACIVLGKLGTADLKAEGSYLRPSLAVVAGTLAFAGAFGMSSPCALIT